MQNFISPGNTLDVVLTAACSAGDVVIQTSIRGVAATNGNVGDTIAVDVVGVFKLPKGSATVFAAGALVGWHGTNKVAIAAGATGNLGFAATAAAAGTTSMTVRLCPGTA